MSFHTPSPGFFSGLTEDRHEIKLGISLRSLILQIMQNLLEAHDRGCLHVSALAETTAEESMRELALGRSHVSKRKPFSRPRDEMPIKPLIVLELKNRLGLLIGRERCQKIVRPLCHLLCGRMAVPQGRKMRQAKNSLE